MPVEEIGDGLYAISFGPGEEPNISFEEAGTLLPLKYFVKNPFWSADSVGLVCIASCGARRESFSPHQDEKNINPYFISTPHPFPEGSDIFLYRNRGRTNVYIDDVMFQAPTYVRFALIKTEGGIRKELLIQSESPPVQVQEEPEKQGPEIRTRRRLAGILGRSPAPS